MHVFAGDFDSRYRAEKNRSGVRGTRGRGLPQMLRGIFKDAAADEVLDEIVADGKNNALREGNLDFEAAEFFGFVDGTAACEMEYRLAVMILAEPASLDGDGARLGVPVGQKDFLHGGEALGKIGEEDRSDFTLISARAKNSR
jgi:hypothetical protein